MFGVSRMIEVKFWVIGRVVSCVVVNVEMLLVVCVLIRWCVFMIFMVFSWVVELFLVRVILVFWLIRILMIWLLMILLLWIRLIL